MALIKEINIVFVQKKESYDVKARELKKVIETQLGYQPQEVRIINKYIVTNCDLETIKGSLPTVFSEPQVDDVFLNEYPDFSSFCCFCVSLQPGQYDQRADAAEQCLRLLGAKNPQVTCITIYAIKGVNDEGMGAIKKYVINPVDSREIHIDACEIDNTIPKTGVMVYKDFIKYDEKRLKAFYDKQSFSMSYDDLLHVQRYFISCKRNPTETELKVIDTYWSDHCRHTTFNTEINKISYGHGTFNKHIKAAYDLYLNIKKKAKRENQPNTLMEIATLPGRYFVKNKIMKNVDLSTENNACAIKTKVYINNKPKNYSLLFKNETHNHPTEIEPFGGASTCLGGAIRDPLSGRTYVYQSMRITGCGDPFTAFKDTLPNKLSQGVITVAAAKGYSSYGNQIGLATGLVDEIYLPNYVAKRFECGAVIGAAPSANIIKGEPKPNDVVILLGGRTGKDGIGAASGSSKSHTKSSLSSSGPQVQKGNPVEERKIQRLFRNKLATRLIKKCNDFGAGGVCVAIGELCAGVEIDLDKIKTKYSGLSGTDLAISESQERMAVVVDKTNAAKFIELCNKEMLEATIVAKVTAAAKLVMKWKNKTIVSLDRSFLNTNGAKQTTDILVDLSTQHKVNELDKLNLASKQSLVHYFDTTIGAGTVVLPYGGEGQNVPADGMVSLIPSFSKVPSTTCSIMCYGFDHINALNNPYLMGQNSIILSLAKLIACGGDYRKSYLSCQEFFLKVNSPLRWSVPFVSLLGAFSAMINLGVGAIGGKDSMSGTYEDLDVPPTLVSFAVTTTQVDKVIDSCLKKQSAKLMVFYANEVGEGIANFHQLKINWECIRNLIKENKVLAASAVKHDGIKQTIFRMALGSNTLYEIEKLDNRFLTAPNYGAIVLQVTDIPTMLLTGASYKEIGWTKNNNMALEQKQIDAFCQPLNPIFGSCQEVNKDIDQVATVKKEIHRFSKKIVHKPLVVIPVFPGTNCEYDLQYAFEREGAKVKQVVINNLTHATLKASLNQLAKEIKECQILCLAGGFSVGDEPDGSAKYIANVLLQPNIKEAIEHFMKNNEGLILGICNGFQALVKCGLLPYGKLQTSTADCPTLTYNLINHHMARIVKTKVVNTNSPWLSLAQLNQNILLPISHGEGRFVCNKKMYEYLNEKGMIFSQYCDFKTNKPTLGFPDNPNGSMYAIEGIVSEDGRILGRMGHVERIGKNLYKNMAGNWENNIIRNGVKYFTHS